MADRHQILKGLFWPRVCEICGVSADLPGGGCICTKCIKRLPLVNYTGCAVCGRYIGPVSAEGLLCDQCTGANAPHFDRAAAALHFEGEARRLLLDYKFNHHTWLAYTFVDLMESAARNRFQVEAMDLVLPMPATLLHRIDRGYNQCAYLARILAHRIDRCYRANVLHRIGRPRRQAGLSKEDRFANVKGTIQVARPELVAGRTVLVVDDVMTTGATLSECAKALKESGASHVYVLTLARAVMG